MALSIKDSETEALARELAARTGESLTEATKQALKDRLRRLPSSEEDKARLLADMEAIRHRIGKLPILDHRSADEILGYDENGLPT